MSILIKGSLVPTLLYSAVLDPGLTRNSTPHFSLSCQSCAFCRAETCPLLDIVAPLSSESAPELLPCNLPSMIFFIIESWRLVWPKNFSFPTFIVLGSDFLVSNCFRTSSFFYFLFPCIQLIVPMRLRNHISHASILSISTFVSVHVSHPYSVTEKT